MVTRSGARGERVSSWAPLNRPCSALGLSRFPATELGSGMAATAPSANAGGAEHRRDTHRGGGIGPTIQQRQERTQGTAAPSKLLQKAPTRLSLREEQSPLDGNHRSRMAKVPAQLLWSSSLEK